MLKAGTKAPLFEAPLDDGSTFRLSDLAGEKNVVLYFYPKDFTAGCTREACDFRDGHDSIGARDAVIVGISRDSIESHRAFREAHNLDFPLASDIDGSVHDMYEVDLLWGIIRRRITYVIDKAGIIRAAFRHDIAIGHHLRDTIAALESIQATSST